MINRECKICGINFVVTTINNRKIYCSKNCKGVAEKQKYFKNHDANKAKVRERVKQARKSNPSLFKINKIKSTYGLSAEEYVHLLDRQKHMCPICYREISGEVNSEKLKAFVDHDHKTGVVRGILCLYCNSLIGYCREDKRILQAAIEYLKKFGK